MIPDEGRRPACHLMRQSQTEKRVLTEDRTRTLVVAEVPAAILVNGCAHGLACVVEKRCPPERLRGNATGKRLDAGTHASGVLQKVVGVVGAPLVQASHGHERWHGTGEHVKLVSQRP